MNRLLRKIIIISAAVFCAGISDVVDLFIPEKSGEITLSALEETDEEILLGDVSLDGVIDSSDASLILAEYSAVSVGKETILSEEQAKAADVDSDGKIDSTDASWVLAYYSAISTGRDITIEELIPIPETTVDKSDGINAVCRRWTSSPYDSMLSSSALTYSISAHHLCLLTF